jgi:hypothetical protein
MGISISTIPNKLYPALILVSLFFIGLGVYFYDKGNLELAQISAFFGGALLLFTIYEWHEKENTPKFKLNMP